MKVKRIKRKQIFIVILFIILSMGIITFFNHGELKNQVEKLLNINPSNEEINKDEDSTQQEVEKVEVYDPTTVPVTGITMTPSSFSLTSGSSRTLSYTVLPEDATNKEVTWSTSNSNVATVSAGTVTAHNSGTAIITVKTVDGNHTATSSVTVTSSPSVTSISISPSSVTLTLGSSTTFHATVYPTSSSQTVTWSSSNTSVATIDQSGRVTTKGTGTTTIKASRNGVYGTATLTVKNSTVHVSSVSISPTSATMSIGTSRQFSASVYPSNATNKSVTWSTSNSSIATVNQSGYVTAKAAGSATIYVRASDGGYTASAHVTVRSNVTGVSVSPTSMTLTTGQSRQLTATVKPSNATNKNVTWSSSNSSVASVSGSGYVTARGTGTATITVRTQEGGYTATCRVTVNSSTFISVTSVTVSPKTGSVVVGETLQLHATVYPTNASNKTVTWSSDQTSIATVSSAGKVTGISPGTAHITVKTNNGGKTSTATIEVTEDLSVIPVTGITISPKPVHVELNQTATLDATISPANATNQNVDWSSSDPDIATVDQNGVITPLAVGTTIITATTQDGNFTDTVTVDVYQNPVTTTPVEGITISPTSKTIVVGESFKFTEAINPEDASNPNVFWDSGDLAIATVDGDGVVTGVNPGTVNITVSTEEGEKTATAIVKVVTAVEEIVINEQNVTGKTGESVRLTYIIKPEEAAEATLIWTSSDESIATVNEDGIVSGVSNGTVTITATDASGTVKGTTKITFTADGEPVPNTGAAIPLLFISTLLIFYFGTKIFMKYYKKRIFYKI